MDVQVGRLDRRITLRKNTTTVDGYGGVVNTFTDVTIWANKDFTGGDGGNEFEEKGVIKANNDTIFTIRHRSVDYNDKVVYKGRTYDIQRIDEIGRNRYLKLFCNTDE